MGHEPELKDQTNLLPKKQLVVVFCALACALLISFIDQNAVGVILPTAGKDLNALSTISWAGTSSLIANTVFQPLYGRLSDIFGRKTVFLSALCLLVIADTLCGFVQTSTQLFLCRGLAGVATGGISALTQMIVSDVVTLEQRGRYQGILGSCVGVGNTIGPFLAAAFLRNGSWRSVFWLIAPLTAVSGTVACIILPSNDMPGGAMRKIKQIDFAGVIFIAATIILLLIPISGGGTYFPWNSRLVIGLMTAGSFCAVVFVIIEWKLAKLPIIPLRVFTKLPVCTLLLQTLLFGMVYYSDLYYLPTYYQNVRGWSAIVSAALIVPLVIGQSLMSIVAGRYISWRKHYGEVMWGGFFLWALGAGLKCAFNRKTSPAVIAVILGIEGCGVGMIFQPTIVAIQAHSTKADRAIVISVRNFLRSLGGAIGLAVSAAILANTLKTKINAVLPDAVADSYRIHNSPYDVPNLSVMPQQIKENILDAYMSASRAVFIFLVPLMGICLLGCFFVKDEGLQRPDEPKVVQDDLLAKDSSEINEKVKELCAAETKEVETPIRQSMEYARRSLEPIRRSLDGRRQSIRRQSVTGVGWHKISLDNGIAENEELPK